MTTTMTMTTPLIAELEQEAVATRRFLERVPKDKLTWRPHPKSFTLGQLALHVAQTPGQIAELALLDTVPLPEFGQVDQPEDPAELLATLEEGLARAKEILGGMSDAQAMEPWRVMKGDQAVMEIPKIGLCRVIMLNHWYHHRGQLSVYLRLLDIPVSAAYGATTSRWPACRPVAHPLRLFSRRSPIPVPRRDRVHLRRWEGLRRIPRRGVPLPGGAPCTSFAWAASPPSSSRPPVRTAATTRPTRCPATRASPRG